MISKTKIIEFLTKISEITETDLRKLTLDTLVTQLEMWDSMAQVAFVIYASGLGVTLITSDIEKAKTLGDLFNLIFHIKED